MALWHFAGRVRESHPEEKKKRWSSHAPRRASSTSWSRSRISPRARVTTITTNVSSQVRSAKIHRERHGTPVVCVLSSLTSSHLFHVVSSRRFSREWEVLSSFEQEALARPPQWYRGDRHIASHVRSLDRQTRSYVHVHLQDREGRGSLRGYPQNVFSTQRRSVFGLCTGKLMDDEPDDSRSKSDYLLIVSLIDLCTDIIFLSME